MEDDCGHAKAKLIFCGVAGQLGNYDGAVEFKLGRESLRNSCDGDISAGPWDNLLRCVGMSSMLPLWALPTAHRQEIY